MENCIKLIKKALRKNKIKNYKVISTTTKCLWYKESFKQISHDNSVLEKIFVIFKNRNKISKFNVSPFEDIGIIESLIESGLKNSFENKQPWLQQKTLLKYNSCSESQRLFFEFDPDKFIHQLKENFEFVEKATGLKINTSYNLKVSKQNLLTDNSCLEQFYMTSDLLCMENTNFQKRASAKDLYLNDSFSEKIICELNKPYIPFAEDNIFDQKLIIIKKEAVANIINEYIVAFYADRLYNGQSFVRKSQIKKVLYNKDFSITSLPFENIYFDLEGTILEEKSIILNGKLVDIISNFTYSRYLNINSFGNSDLENPEMISHQRLKFSLNESFPRTLTSLDNTLVIHKFENLLGDITGQNFMGLAVCERNGKTFYKQFNLSFSKFFNNIFVLDDKSQWVKNVYCNDIVFVN